MTKWTGVAWRKLVKKKGFIEENFFRRQDANLLLMEAMVMQLNLSGVITIHFRKWEKGANKHLVLQLN